MAKPNLRQLLNSAKSEAQEAVPVKAAAETRTAPATLVAAEAPKARQIDKEAR